MRRNTFRNSLITTAGDLEPQIPKLRTANP